MSFCLRQAHAYNASGSMKSDIKLHGCAFPFLPALFLPHRSARLYTYVHSDHHRAIINPSGQNLNLSSLHSIQNPITCATWREYGIGCLEKEPQSRTQDLSRTNLTNTTFRLVAHHGCDRDLGFILPSGSRTFPTVMSQGLQLSYFSPLNSLSFPLPQTPSYRVLAPYRVYSVYCVLFPAGF